MIIFHQQKKYTTSSSVQPCVRSRNIICEYSFECKPIFLVVSSVITHLHRLCKPSSHWPSLNIFKYPFKVWFYQFNWELIRGSWVNGTLECVVPRSTVTAASHARLLFLFSMISVFLVQSLVKQLRGSPNLFDTSVIDPHPTFTSYSTVRYLWLLFVFIDSPLRIAWIVYIVTISPCAKGVDHINIIPAQQCCPQT